MLAVGSTTVSISSSNGRFGGCAMVSRSGVATKALRRQRLAVERERTSFELLAVEHERRRRAGAVRLELELGADCRRGRIERHVEIDGLDQPVGRAVILEADGAWFFGAHDAA